MGKSGHIAGKIAATMRSTGTAALYLHPGMQAMAILESSPSRTWSCAITWSGETTELRDILHYCNQYDVMLIVATAHPESSAGARSGHLPCHAARTRSLPERVSPDFVDDTAARAGRRAGDGADRGARLHSVRLSHVPPRPARSARNSARWASSWVLVMRSRVSVADASLTSATIEMSRKRYGCTAVVDEANRLVGAFTDGDLRRCIAVHDLNDNIGLHMSPRPLTVTAETLASEALRILNENAILVLFVEDGGKLVGIIHMHDIVRAGQPDTDWA
jgi:arabinose-5-phosphate isomerase